MSWLTNKPVVALLALPILMGLIIRTARAGVAVAPLKTEVSLKPGEQVDVPITLSYNNRLPTDGPQKLNLIMMDVRVTEEGALAFSEPGTAPQSASQWLTVKAPEVTLQPGTSAKAEIHLSVPPSAAPGEYYATVMVMLANKGSTEKGVSVQYRIASGIFVTVLGRTFPREARITRAELVWPTAKDLQAATTPATAPATAPATQPIPPAELLPSLKVLLENTGHARFDATGKLTILDNQARIVLVSPLATKRNTVFGGDSRLFDAVINKALPAGIYTFRVELDYQSAWAKARQDLHVEILPEQAALLAHLRQQQHMTAPLVEATPDTLTAALPAGASRTMAVTVKNISEHEVSCTAGVAASSGSGADLIVRPEQFTLAKGARKTVEVRVLSTPLTGGANGKLSAMVNVEADQDGAGHTTVSIPVDIQQKTER